MSSYRTLVLCYHAVSDRWDDALAVAPAAFERQIALALRGLRPGSIEDAVAGRARTLVVTFDDGYTSVMETLPFLERRGLRAAVFACSAYGDGHSLTIPELDGPRGLPERERRTLGWDDLRELVERGHEVGSHTVSHPHLTQLGDDELAAELTDSRRQLEDELGRPCRYLAYPYGNEDGRVRAAARDSGYAAAFGLPGRLKPRDDFSLPRVGVYRGESLLRVALKLSGSVRRLRDVRCRREEVRHRS